MWYRIQTFVNQAYHVATSMDSRQWMVASAVLLVVGFFCLRGFGSRKNY